MSGRVYPTSPSSSPNVILHAQQKKSRSPDGRTCFDLLQRGQFIFASRSLQAPQQQKAAKLSAVKWRSQAIQDRATDAGESRTARRAQRPIRSSSNYRAKSCGPPNLSDDPPDRLHRIGHGSAPCVAGLRRNPEQVTRSGHQPAEARIMVNRVVRRVLLQRQIADFTESLFHGEPRNSSRPNKLLIFNERVDQRLNVLRPSQQHGPPFVKLNHDTGIIAGLVLSDEKADASHR
jgi:hypothetical protein